MTTQAKAVILAAGRGTRMKSNTPKVLHKVLGQPMILWVVGKALRLGCEEVAVVVGYAREQVEHTVRNAFPNEERITFHLQEQTLGTGDAVRAASTAFEDYEGRVLILCGDVPNVPAFLLQQLLEATDGPASLITAIAPPGTHYGRVVRGDDNDVQEIVEFKDADEETRAIQEINTGNYAFDASFLLEGLRGLDTNNAQGEFYLTDLIAMAAGDEQPATGIIAPDIHALDGVNTREDLGHANEVALRTARSQWMKLGVTMLQPSTVWLDADVALEPDALLEPHVSLLSGTTVGAGARVESFSRLSNCTVEPGACVPAHTVADAQTFSS